MQKITSFGNVFECLGLLSFALEKSIYVCGAATQAQSDCAAKISNYFYEAKRLYDERWGSAISSGKAYCLAAAEEVRKARRFIESDAGKAFVESLPAPSRAIVEAIELFCNHLLS